MKSVLDPSPLLREATQLWSEAGSVIVMRSAKLASGQDPHGREATRMVAEKLEMGWKWGLALSMGQLGWTPDAVMHKSMRMMRREVRANIRRLKQDN